jgi:hypothetical protein
MALTLNDFSGAETGGLEETSATVGTPTAPTANPRSGARAYRLAAGDAIEFAPFATVADAGTDYVVGASVSFDDVSPAAAVPFLSLREGAAEFLRLELTTGGDVLVVDAGGATIRTISGPFTAAAHHFVEVYFQHSASGTVEVFIDDASQGSDSARDLTDGGTFDTVRFENAAASAATLDVDDYYLKSGATAAADRFGPVEVFGYQAWPSSDTDNGSALDLGTWDLAGETPLDASAGHIVSYTANNKNGSADSDGTGGGPSGDSNIDGDSNIKAAKWVFHAQRTNGSNSAPFLRYGDTGGTTDSGDILTTDFANHVFLSETTNVPSSTQFFRMGGGKGSGGRDVEIGEMWGMLLHVPVGATTKTLTGSLEAALQKQRTLTASAGAALQSGRTRTAEASAALALLRTRSAGIEGVLSAVGSVDAGLEAALRDTLGRQLGLDAGVAAGKTGEATLDSALARAGTASAGSDAALRKSQVATALADAALQIERERQAGLAAALALARIGVANLDAALRRLETRSAGLDAALEAVQSAAAALDAGLARETTVAAALQAAVRATVSAAAGLDASISAISLRTTTAGLGAALRATAIAGAALNAALEFARETSAAADAALAGTALLGAGLDASLDLPFAPAGTRTFGHGADRDQVITAGGRTFVVPAGNRKH